jgi:hypothetical protein
MSEEAEDVARAKVAEQYIDKKLEERNLCWGLEKRKNGYVWSQLVIY